MYGMMIARAPDRSGVKPKWAEGGYGKEYGEPLPELKAKVVELLCWLKEDGFCQGSVYFQRKGRMTSSSLDSNNSVEAYSRLIGEVESGFEEMERLMLHVRKDGKRHVLSVLNRSVEGSVEGLPDEFYVGGGIYFY